MNEEMLHWQELFDTTARVVDDNCKTDKTLINSSWRPTDKSTGDFLFVNVIIVSCLSRNIPKGGVNDIKSVWYHGRIVCSTTLKIELGISSSFKKEPWPIGREVVSTSTVFCVGSFLALNTEQVEKFHFGKICGTMNRGKLAFLKNTIIWYFT